MPLEQGSSRAAFSHNVREMIAAGHPQKQAVAAAYREAGETAKDMAPSDWRGMLKGFLKWLMEEEQEPEHAEDRDGMAQDSIAFDKASVRAYDNDGHLHVEEANLSKATVNPYRGAEIPDWQSLGLDPDKIYHLLRHPDELKKAAESFNGKPLLMNHKPVTAEDHDHEGTVGAVRDVTYEHPYLRGKLDVWSAPAIDAIKSGLQKELSSAYRYKVDMTPGTYEGQHHDGIMRDISGNHVALVREGRCGPDCVVGDSIENLGDLNMAKIWSRKALLSLVAPKLAQDGVDADTVAKVIEAVANVAPPAEEKKDDPAAMDDERMEKLRAICGDKLGDEELAKILEMMAPATNDSAPAGMGSSEAGEVDGGRTDSGGGSTASVAPTDSGDYGSSAADPGAPNAASESMTSNVNGDEDPEDEDEEKARKEKEKKDMVTKPAMDAAISSAVKAAVEAANRNQIEIRNAERFVRPWVGDLNIACDSAEHVYRTALKTLNVKADGLHKDALRPILEAQPKPGEKKGAVPTKLAQDAKTTASFFEMFPGAKDIRIGA